MARADIRAILSRPEVLAAEIDAQVPNSPRTLELRSDLAGLLVVSMAASYEACVKEVLTGYARRHHPQFGNYTANRYAKLSSKVALNDLYEYARTFNPQVHNLFGKLIVSRKDRYLALTGKDITSSYKQILKWRHDFAHASIRTTTMEEALLTHRLAKPVMYIFDEAFSISTELQVADA